MNYIDECVINNKHFLSFSPEAAPGNDIDKDLSTSLGLNHGMGRITGSASIETLVRVGIEKEHGLSPDSKMVVLHDFTPCVDDELEVKRGQIVNILYRENDWVYVIGQDTRQEGFIPHSYCAPYNTQLADLAIKKKLPRDQSLGPHTNSTTADLIDGVPDISNDLLDETTVSGLIGLQSSMIKLSQASLSSEPDFLPFSKDPSGRYIVLYTFIARDENDVSVERGEFVTVLNREDPEWFWIVRSDGQEGFIPSGFVYPADHFLQANAKVASLTLPPQAHTPNLNANPNVGQTAIINGNVNMAIANGIINGNMGNTATATVAATTPATTITANNNSNNNNNNNVNNSNNDAVQTQAMEAVDELRYHGTELVMLYDYRVGKTQFVFFSLIIVAISFYLHPRHKHQTICPFVAVIGSMQI